MVLGGEVPAHLAGLPHSVGSSSAWDLLLLLQGVGSQLPPVPASLEVEWLGAAVLISVWDHPVGAAEVLGESLCSASAEWQVVPKHLVGFCFRNTMCLGAVDEDGTFHAVSGAAWVPSFCIFVCAAVHPIIQSQCCGFELVSEAAVPASNPMCCSAWHSPSTLCLVFGFPSWSPCGVCGFAGRVIPLESLKLPGRGLRDETQGVAGLWGPAQ